MHLEKNRDSLFVTPECVSDEAHLRGFYAAKKHFYAVLARPNRVRGSGPMSVSDSARQVRSGAGVRVSDRALTFASAPTGLSKVASSRSRPTRHERG